MDEWVKYKLKEVCPTITDGSHFSPKEFSEGMPMFSVKDMTEQGFDYSRVKRISEADYYALIKQGCQPQIGDILIAKDGSVLKHIFEVKEKPDYVLLSSIAILRPDKNKVDSSFLNYLLQAPQTTETILTNYVSGSGVPRIVLKDFKDVDVNIPDTSCQKKIAEILSSLDDKIYLLHRQNKTLEQLAETLFRQMFVEGANESWKSYKISELNIYVSDFVANGSFASLKANVKLINDREDYALFIRNTDLKSDFEQKVFVDKHSYEFLSKTKLFGGEVIISNVADVGSVHLCPKFNIPMTLGNNVIMLKSKFNYFLYILKASWGKN